MYKRNWIWLAAFGLAFPAGLAMAEEAPEPEAAPEYAGMEATTGGPSWEMEGWIDQSIWFDQSVSNPAYGLFEVAFRMSHSINENFGGALQLNARWYQDPTGGLLGLENGALSLLAREAYAYVQDSEERVRVQFGKWYAPIGFELADPPDLWQYTNSNVFDYFLPTEMVGVIGYFTFSELLDLAFYTGGAPSDDDWAMAARIGSPAVGTRLGLTLGDVGLGFSGFLTNGGVFGGEGDKSLLFDIDGSIESVENLLIGFEFALMQDFAADALDLGLMVMANYAFTDAVSLTGRYDIVLLDGGGNVMSGTISPLINFAPGWDILFEARIDLASDDPSVGAVGTAPQGGSNFTGGLELIYQFL